MKQPTEFPAGTRASHPQSDRGRRTSHGPPARIRVTLNFGVLWDRYPMTNGSVKSMHDYIRGRYPANKRLSVLEFIERSLDIYLQRPLRVHSQVLMESTNARGIQFLSVLFREPPPRFVLDERSRFSILTTGVFLSCKLHFLASLKGVCLKRDYNQLYGKHYIRRKY